MNRYTTLEIRRLLKDRTLSLADISEHLHFSSPSHFSLFFYKQTGVLPSDYRK
ncbi:MAG: helix-turn-helix domain-containing protein [Bacteroidaceae bacterium]|nr:helix-turn-helix domain-containing protein [Bacteroidaceae bacterium]